MDINLTGTVAANVSLIQPLKTDYLPLATQVTTTILTALITLAGVYLNQHLNLRSDEKKRLYEEENKKIETQRKAYQDFLDTFSTIFFIPSDSNEDFMKQSGNYLRAALNAAEFGDIDILEPISIIIFDDMKTIKSLRDIIDTLLKLRYENPDYGIIARIECLETIRKLASEKIGDVILKNLMSSLKANIAK
jgi:hypothetical protein